MSEGNVLTDRLDDLLQLINQGAETDLNIVLLMSGSFNPIHRGHIRSLDLAMQTLASYLSTQTEARQRFLRDAPSHTNVRVVAGVLASSSDDWVTWKLGDAAIPLVERCEMCHLALGDQEFAPLAPRIFVARHGIACGQQACAAVLRDIKSAQRRIGSASDNNVVVLPFYGSDYFANHPHSCRHPTVIVARNDAVNSNDKCLQELRRQTIHPQFVFLTSKGVHDCATPVASEGDASPLHFPDIGDFSSTRVRQLVTRILAAVNPHDRAELDGIVTEAVATKLLERDLNRRSLPFS